MKSIKKLVVVQLHYSASKIYHRDVYLEPASLFSFRYWVCYVTYSSFIIVHLIPQTRSKAIRFVNHLLNASKLSCHFHSCKIFGWAQSRWTIITIIRNTLDIPQNDSMYSLNKPTHDNIVNKLLDAMLAFLNRQVSS